MSGSGRAAPLIRQAEPRDAAGIATCHVRSWQVAYRGQVPDEYLDALPSEIPQRTTRWERWIGERDQRRQHQLVAVDGDEVAGFVTFGPNEEGQDPSVGELYAIYLDPSYWGRGVGRGLMDAAVAGLRADGYAAAVLWVLESNDRARRFYEIAGWSADGGRKTERRNDFELREVRYWRAL